MCCKQLPIEERATSKAARNYILSGAGGIDKEAMDKAALEYNPQPSCCIPCDMVCNGTLGFCPGIGEADSSGRICCGYHVFRRESQNQDDTQEQDVLPEKDGANLVRVESEWEKAEKAPNQANMERSDSESLKDKGYDYRPHDGDDKYTRSQSLRVPTDKKTFIERVFEQNVGEWVTNPNYFKPIGAVFFIFICIMAYGTTQLEPTDNPDQMFPDDHRFQRIFTIIDTKFAAGASGDQKAKVYLVWGLQGEVDADGNCCIDNSDVVPLVDVERKGTLKYDRTLRLDAATQLHFQNVCSDLRTHSLVGAGEDDGQGSVNCWVDNWQIYLRSQNKTFPLRRSSPTANEHAEVMVEFTKFLNTTALQRDERGRYRKYGQIHEKQLSYYGPPGQELTFFIIEADMTIRLRGQQKASLLQGLYEQWQALAESINARAPSTSNKMYQIANGSNWAGSKWVWMHTQQLYKFTAVRGAFIGLGLAFVVIFVSTQALTTALIATLVIGCILTTVTGMMWSYGWKLGTVESICVTILAGFSIDYTVHLTHMYTMSPYIKRQARARDSLSVIGVSVFSGMFTSFFGSIPLMLCILQFFVKFGQFMCTTVVAAYFWANLPLMILLANYGPERQVDGATAAKVELAPDLPANDGAVSGNESDKAANAV